MFKKHIDVKQECCKGIDVKDIDSPQNKKHIKEILKEKYNLRANEPDLTWVKKVLNWCKDYEDHKRRELYENNKVAGKQTYEFNASSGVLVFNLPFSRSTPITKETLNLGRRNLQKEITQGAILTIVLKFKAAKMQGVFVLDYVEFPHAMMTFTFGSEGDGGLALIDLLQNQLHRALTSTRFCHRTLKNGIVFLT